MRIAFVTPEFTTEAASFDGGLANYLLRVCLALIELGHEPVVIVRSDRDETLTVQGIEVQRVKIEFNNWWVRFMQWRFGYKQNSTVEWKWISLCLNRRLAALRRHKSFDIVQYSSYVATGYYRIKSIPAVVRLSSYEPLLREARGIIYPTLDHLNMEELERESLCRADGIFGPSKLIGAAVQQEIGREVELIETPFLMDATNLDDSIYRQHVQGKPYFLCFGTISRIKGMDILAQIIYDVLAKYPDHNFIFVGKDSDGIIPQLKQNAVELSDRLIFLEKMPHSQLYPIVQNAELVIMPSRVDNFPNTCLEAMAFKRVVIGTYGTSFEQLLVDGVSGLLCERENPTDLLAAIERGMSLSAEQKASIGEKAYERIQQLTPEKVVNQLIAYYSGIISAKSKH